MTTATHGKTAAGEVCRWPAMPSVEENLRQARQVVEHVRRAAGTAVTEAELTIRREPLRAFGTAILAGAFCGGLCGFGAGWLAHRRA